MIKREVKNLAEMSRIHSRPRARPHDLPCYSGEMSKAAAVPILLFSGLSLYGQTYTLSTTVQPPGTGTVRGAGSYQPGARVQVIGTPANGYYFTGFSGGLQGPINSNGMLVPDEARRGRFLAFRTDTAAELTTRLAAANIIVDHRADRLRIGFGIYHDDDDPLRLARAIATL